MRASAQTREHVLDVAHELFYWNGIRSVGVDRIAHEAGVAPTTLYRLFSSKDDLVAAYVERNADGYRQWFDAAAGPAGLGPRDRILALFDALAGQVRPEHCRGCPFLMALAEYADPESPVHRGAVEVKAWVRSRFADLVDGLAAGRPAGDRAELADQLTLTLEGTYASVAALGADGPARRARALAATLITAYAR